MQLFWGKNQKQVDPAFLDVQDSDLDDWQSDGRLMHSSQKEVCRLVSEPDLHLTADLLTCEPAGLRQQEGAPGHEEEEGRLQQREAVQLGELGDVRGELKMQTRWYGNHLFVC